MSEAKLEIKRLPHAEGIDLPSYKSSDAAGMDIRAALDETVLLKPGERALIPTGLQFAIPRGYEIQVRPRSGLAIKHGITMLNSPGTIDADYRGEVKLIAINHGQHNFKIERGERLAQLIIAPVVQMPVVEVDKLDETERGDGGFGSTGRG
jgi:dUTP pyrophosphatase